MRDDYNLHCVLVLVMLAPLLLQQLRQLKSRSHCTAGMPGIATGIGWQERLHVELTLTTSVSTETQH